MNASWHWNVPDTKAKPWLLSNTMKSFSTALERLDFWFRRNDLALLSECNKMALPCLLTKVCTGSSVGWNWLSLRTSLSQQCNVVRGRYSSSTCLLLCWVQQGQRLWLRPDAARFVQSGAKTSCPENDKYSMEITEDFHSERQHNLVCCGATALSLYVQVALRRETRETISSWGD